ncbi:MAG: DnaD domain protein [Oscillospiraceae bacterium]|jgi:DnaD/phage-associated family protein|nr:DnaD domain protein [Oscillospiraceae bacterium]
MRLYEDKMKFLIDIGMFNSIFAVPTSVVDEHIKLVGSAQLKVLLWMLRHSEGGYTGENIAKDLSMSLIDVNDAMTYWIETGVLSSKSKDHTNFNQPPDTVASKTSKETNEKQLPVIKPSAKRRLMSRPQKPDSESVAKRIREDVKIAFLMEEAQIILGRTLSNGDSALLLMIHDNDGLPVDVITMLLQYVVNIGKSNMKYIEKVAISWGIEEIDTVEKADKKIRELCAVWNAWKSLQRIIGVDRRSPTAKEEEVANRWINEWKLSEELIQEAYNCCVDSKGRYIPGYMDSILKRWRALGIDSEEKVRLDKAEFSKKGTSKKRKPSYDIKKYKDFSIFN